MKKIGNLILNNKRWIVFAIIILIFIILAESVFLKEAISFDTSIYNFLVEHRTEYFTNFLKFITHFGDAFILIIITLLCIIFVKNKKYKITIPVNLATIALINVILKNIFERPRPMVNKLVEETGFSFPSGHSMASMAFYGYFIYLAYTNIKNKSQRNLICVLLSILIFIIGFSRIYLGAHYASDVIAGICFSVAYLIIGISTGIMK